MIKNGKEIKMLKSGYVWHKVILLIIAGFLLTRLNAQIIINEVRPADETSDYCSYIELKNTGTRSQSLDGWVIKYTPMNGIQDGPGYLDNLGTTGFFLVPSGLNLASGDIAVFYFGCSGTNDGNVRYVPEKNKVPEFSVVSLYNRTPTDNGGLWYGSSLQDFLRFGKGKNPPREVVWDNDKRSSGIWVARHSSGILIDIGAVYNQWPDTNSYVNTERLPRGASISHDGTDSNSPEDWHLTPATPGKENSNLVRSLPPAAPGPVENNSLPALELKDTRPILYAASFDHMLQGDYPRDWHYYLMRSNVIDREYNSASTIIGSWAVNSEYGERGLWVTPASYVVVNTNMAAAVFGEDDWTDYRVTFTIKETTGDCNRHQLAEFYTRLVNDTGRLEGYQFNFIGGTSISVRHSLLCHGADIGTVNIHPDVDFWGGGQNYGVFEQLVKNTGGYTDDCNALPENAKMPDPCKDKIDVVLQVKGDSIFASYDNRKGGKLITETRHQKYKKGKMGIGLVYGNYIFNDILVEDLRDNPTGNQPVAVIQAEKDTIGINVTVKFSAEKSIYSGDQQRLSYDWDFGDGIRGTGQRPAHSFAGTGTYLVTCTVSDGIKQTKDGVFVTVTGPDDTSPPTNVTNIRASAQNDSVTLNWDAAVDNETGISGYIIYRGTSGGPEYPLVTVCNLLEFTDPTRQADTRFYYRIKAINGVKLKSSGFSNEASALTTTAVGPAREETRLIKVVRSASGTGIQIMVNNPIEQQVNLEVLSVSGTVVAELCRETLQQGTYEYFWSMAGYKTGVYFVRIKSSGKTDTKAVPLF
ncbi:MAG: PKD domain-containing protein [Fibrobacteria bacterium]|nr:PKD domain-containing protein [Fibrobacteria bacterium]